MASTPASANSPRVRIADADLAELQRNIVLSHAAGVGPATAVETTRLMMALKLASLAQGASGVRLETLRLIEAMLARGLTPIVPAQGSVGASGDLAPLAHMAATMIGVGEAHYREQRPAGGRSARRSRPRADRVGAERRAGAAQRHAILHRQRAGRAVRGGSAAARRAGRPARCRPTRRAAPTPRSIRASMRCAVTAARSTSRSRCGR